MKKLRHRIVLVIILLALLIGLLPLAYNQYAYNRLRGDVLHDYPTISENAVVINWVARGERDKTLNLYLSLPIIISALKNGFTEKYHAAIQIYDDDGSLTSWHWSVRKGKWENEFTNPVGDAYKVEIFKAEKRWKFGFLWLSKGLDSSWYIALP